MTSSFLFVAFPKREFASTVNEAVESHTEAFGAGFPTPFLSRSIIKIEQLKKRATLGSFLLGECYFLGKHSPSFVITNAFSNVVTILNISSIEAFNAIVEGTFFL